jgi:tellurite resistance protein TerC
MTPLLFPLGDFLWFYAAFAAIVLLLLALDLGVFHRKAHGVGFREAAIWTGVWVALALIFCFGLYQYASWKFGDSAGKQVALEFLTGYVVEESLSLDNMFVFVLIFKHFGVPLSYHHRVLFYGILGALVFRAGFIALGSALMQYGWTAIVFGGFLVVTGIRMMAAPDRKMQPEKSLLVRVLRKIVPVTSDFDGPRFFTRLQGTLHATPLLLTLVIVEASDILFAIDSVPAIFAITREPLIVYTSNVFAILGLRSIYFLLAGAVEKFYLLHYGLALVLVFVGLKMALLNTLWDGHFPIGISLGVIAGLVALFVGLSLAFPKKTIMPVPTGATSSKR